MNPKLARHAHVHACTQTLEGGREGGRGGGGGQRGRRETHCFRSASLAYEDGSAIISGPFAAEKGG